MERITIQVGSYGENCTVVTTDDGRTYVIDPGAEGERIAGEIEKRGLRPAAVLLTHAHFDHIGGIPDLQRRFADLPVYVHPADEVMLAHPYNQNPPDYPLAPKPSNVRDCRELGDGGVDVIETPGHTPGGVSYHFPSAKLLLSGDTLFAGSVGRTDFPGGSMATLVESLKKLTALPDGTTVVPGHGPETTIGAEKRGNPFLI